MKRGLTRIIGITLRLLIAASLVFEGNVLLKFLFEILKLFGRRMFELLESFGIGLFNLRRQPESLDQIERDDSQQHDHQQHLPESLEVADQTHDCAAEEVTCACEYENPQEATRKRKQQESEVRHVSDAVKHTRRPTQSINVFGKKDRERAEFVRQSLQPRLRGAVETKLPDTFTKTAPRKVSDVIAQAPANRSPHQHLRKAVRAEKRAVSKHAGQQERDVSLQHDEDENCVKPVLKQQIVKKVEVHEKTRL